MSKEILFVEDEPTVSSGYTRVLERRGYVVDIVTDAASAIHRLLVSGRRYDLLLVDLELPLGWAEGVDIDETRVDNMSAGWHVLGELRQSTGPNSNIPAVVFTAYSYRFPDFAELLGQHNVAVSFDKGTSPSDVIREIERLLATNEPQQERPEVTGGT
jgi:CheY-like chemotaxis protein